MWHDMWHAKYLWREKYTVKVKMISENQNILIILHSHYFGREETSLEDKMEVYIKEMKLKVSLEKFEFWMVPSHFVQVVHVHTVHLFAGWVFNIGMEKWGFLCQFFHQAFPSKYESMKVISRVNSEKQ